MLTEGTEAVGDFMAEFLEAHSVASSTDFTSTILSAIPEFIQQLDDDPKQTKPLAKFLTSLSDRLPISVMKSMVHLKCLVDGASYVVRVGMMEVLGSLILHLGRGEDHAVGFAQAKGLYDVLTARLMDKNSWVRGKVLTVLAKLARFVSMYLYCLVNERLCRRI